MVGPWTHRGIGSGERIGDVDFGPEAGIDLLGLHLRWYDRRLRGIENGIDDEPPIRIFVMGANVWRDEQEWPLARTRFTPYYLHGAGRANSLFGDGVLSTTPPAADEPPDRYDYDPADPVPTLGGQSMIESPGPLDRRPVERRDDVLVYSTEPLDARRRGDRADRADPVRRVERRRHRLHGDAGRRPPERPGDRTSARASCAPVSASRWSSRSLIEPGRVYEYRIVLWETSNVFKAGHRIRVEVSSSNFPRFDRNLNTGEDLATGTHPTVAHQTVFHTPRAPVADRPADHPHPITRGHGTSGRSTITNCSSRPSGL